MFQQCLCGTKLDVAGLFMNFDTAELTVSATFAVSTSVCALQCTFP